MGRTAMPSDSSERSAVPVGGRVTVRLEASLDEGLDLPVGGSAPLQLRGDERFLDADAAAGGVLVGEAGEERLVLELQALLALAEAVQPVQRRRVFPGDFVRAGDFGLVDPGIGKQLGIQDLRSTQTCSR